MRWLSRIGIDRLGIILIHVIGLGIRSAKPLILTKNGQYNISTKICRKDKDDRLLKGGKPLYCASCDTFLQFILLSVLCDTNLLETTTTIWGNFWNVFGIICITNASLVFGYDLFHGKWYLSSRAKKIAGSNRNIIGLWPIYDGF